MSKCDIMSDTYLMALKKKKKKVHSNSIVILGVGGMFYYRILNSDMNCQN